ncbi:MAG: Rrf2 family transcriptional regulator [Candidatus Zixiibacteriota bacterium]|nr:MAG: Rrf2 family transcriptional regulator [candidate division Zixibacteria bacterium]
MQFSVGCEYAVHGLLYLAMQPENEVVLVTDIARAQNLPVSYLAKVFQLLAKSGLVKSFRGARGGYMLAQPPEAITLHDITQAIEGASPLYSPLSNRRDCTLETECLIRETFLRAERAMNRELEKVSLREMTEQAGRLKDRMKWLQTPENRTVHK